MHITLQEGVKGAEDYIKFPMRKKKIINAVFQAFLIVDEVADLDTLDPKSAGKLLTFTAKKLTPCTKSQVRTAVRFISKHRELNINIIKFGNAEDIKKEVN